MNILVLAGGADQIALIQELRSRNVQNIVLIDYYENPPAKKYADKHVVASTLDVEAVKRICISVLFFPFFQAGLRQCRSYGLHI